MLMLTRKTNEQIYIGKKGDVLEGPIIVAMGKISVADDQSPRARVGVECQRNIDVKREEIWRQDEERRIANEFRAAAGV